MNDNNDFQIVNDDLIDKYYFYDKDFENKLCVDCKAALPEYVSINNGVVICGSCAERHCKLGHSISYVRKIDQGWDHLLLSYLERGSNNRFLRFATQSNISELPIEEKYTTRFCQYYRLLLKSEIYADEPPEVPNKEQGMKKCDVDIDYFPEFIDYQLIKEEMRSEIDKKEDYKENSIDIIKGSKKMWNVLSKTGKILYKTSKPVACFIGKTTVKGVGMAYTYLTKDKDDTKQIQKEKKKEDSKKEVQQDLIVKKDDSEISVAKSYNQKENTHEVFENILKKGSEKNTILNKYENQNSKCKFDNTNKTKARKAVNTLLVNFNF